MSPQKLSNDIKLKVRRIFTSYLEQEGLRRTPERYAILDEIYSGNGHFDVEELYEQMKKRKYTVSRATVYNTLDLLVHCNLVIRHQFGNATQAIYEKGYGFKQHDHLICNKCSKIMEFCDPRIQQIQNVMGELLQFEVTGHSLHLFADPKTDSKGVCLSCNKNIKKETK